MAHTWLFSMSHFQLDMIARQSQGLQVLFAYLEALLPLHSACIIIPGNSAVHLLLRHCCLDEEVLFPTQQHPVHNPTWNASMWISGQERMDA